MGSPKGIHATEHRDRVACPADPIIGLRKAFSVAAPRIVLCIFNAHIIRIHVDVSHRRQEMLVLIDGDRCISALEDVPDMPVTPIEPVRIGTQEPLHHLRDALWCTLQKKMDMIVHQTPCEDTTTLFEGHLLQESGKVLFIPVVLEQLPAA